MDLDAPRGRLWEEAYEYFVHRSGFTQGKGFTQFSVMSPTYRGSGLSFGGIGSLDDIIESFRLHAASGSKDLFCSSQGPKKMVHTRKTLCADVSGGKLWINILHKSPKHGLASKAWADYLPLTERVKKGSQTNLHLDSRYIYLFVAFKLKALCDSSPLLTT
ncbi:hypothetical protein PVL29_011926 [Vitis rotundifolia]|uniref:Uncharacterized protein n=1 Tax=Vitis rotundifolia TaxID=103349 RepID=A0AA39DQ38_VITRO|nr:hypothetical protein PVL29_011926 [Vitis rotundifolia]